jgi:hypothetical protein
MPKTAEQSRDTIRARKATTDPAQGKGIQNDPATAVRQPINQPVDPNFWANMNAKWAKDAEEAKVGNLTGTITDLINTTAGQVYKDKAKDPERPVINIEITASDGKKFYETFSYPDGAASWRNSKFKLGIFMKVYGKLPEVGMSVKVGFDADGFYTLTM